MKKIDSFLLAIVGIVTFQAGAIELTVNKPSLCDEEETIIFSCTLDGGSRIHSICASRDEQMSARQAIRYKLGVNKKNIELIYPKERMPVEEVFSFMSRSGVNEGDIEILSFSMGDIAYDVMMPANIEYMSHTFVGLEITHPEAPAELYECDEKSIAIDLKPIRNILRIPENGRFYESLPRVKIADPGFSMVSEKGNTNGFKTSISYPRTGIEAIESEIVKFASCGSSEYSRENGGECIRDVHANIVDEKLLVFYFESYDYAAGSAHGSNGIETHIYRKQGQGWESTKPQDMFIESTSCRNKIGRLIFRQLWPLGIPSLDADGGKYSDPNRLFEEANIAFVEQGVLFRYHQYQLDGYIPPADTLVSWKSIGSCLR